MNDLINSIRAAAPAFTGEIPVPCTYKTVASQGQPDTRVIIDTQAEIDRKAKLVCLRKWQRELPQGGPEHVAIVAITSVDPQRPGLYLREWALVEEAWISHCSATGVPMPDRLPALIAADFPK